MANRDYDVLIVGSGHSGGMAANILTRKGISCLMLNAGPAVDFSRDRTTKSAYELPYRGFNKPGRLEHVFQADEFNANTWVDEQEVPYTFERSSPYNWVRVRLVGGRSLFWARQSFRLSDYEFKAKDHDGHDANWPISLADLAPYYSRVEGIFHVAGRKEGLPQFPDGNFIEIERKPEPESMQRIIDAAAQRGIVCSKFRVSRGVNGLASSVNLLLPDALDTGNLDVVPNAVVREITVDKKTGLVNGVYFLDRHSRREMHAKARVIVLAAGCLESTRLLLNSGIANSSGVLGHYLADQMYGCPVVASVPEARDGKAKPGLMGSGLFIPRFRNLKRGEKHNFIRGYSLTVSSGEEPDPKFFADYGEELEKKMDSYRGSLIAGGIFGEVLPRFENHVRINKDVVDAWGIPVLHVDTRYGDNEHAMTKDASDMLGELYRAAGYEILSKSDKVYPPGYSIHELGTCRMGDDPKTSVLNQWNQSHDIKNLFVVDASSFVTGGWQNPSMTILALSMRASEYLATQLQQRNL